MEGKDERNNMTLLGGDSAVVIQNVEEIKVKVELEFEGNESEFNTFARSTLNLHNYKEAHFNITGTTVEQNMMAED